MSSTETAEEGAAQAPNPDEQQKHGSKLALFLLLLNCTLVFVGLSGPLLLRVYFIHGGKRRWLSSWVQACGWPLLFLPLSFSYLYHRRWLLMSPSLFVSCSVIGIINGLDSYLYAYSSSYLPVSTSAILISTQLAFTALFAFLLVKQRFTVYSTNAVFLLTLGALSLGLKAGIDRPEGESKAHYFLGFTMALLAAALYGFMMPLTELAYRKSKQKISYTLVVEATMVIAAFAAGFCLVGMLINKDFQAIRREAKEYGLGERKYYMVMVWGAVTWQLYNLGIIGLVLCSSSLLSGVVMAMSIPVAEILAVILLHEKFDERKGLALALALWGFGSYFYGEHQKNRKKTKQRSSSQVSTGVAVP